jgi:hypothetical protein
MHKIYKSQRLKGREYLKDLNVDGMRKLKLILKNTIWWCGLGLFCLGLLSIGLVM